MVHQINRSKIFKAKERFQAVTKCSSIRAAVTALFNCRNATALAVEAQSNLNNGNFSEAKNKFQDAYNLVQFLLNSQVAVTQPH